ncbi:MAG: hypothetical protein JWN70_5168, partial [Planctomycetaceae bacterium]|nr:hypothetical protein [Planctomycetaceae bacterium]
MRPELWASSATKPFARRPPLNLFGIQQPYWMTSPVRGFGHLEELTCGLANCPGSVQQLQARSLFRVSDMFLHSVKRHPIVKNHASRTNLPDLSKDLQMILAQRGRNGTSEEEILIRVDQQHGLKRSPELVNSRSHFGQCEPRD